MGKLFIEKRKTAIEGVWELLTQPHLDARGRFVKTYQDKAFCEIGLEFKVREEFYSVSGKNVLRGMHFQIPPFETAKAVFCLRGRAMQCEVDLRQDSPSCGKHVMIELSQEKANGVFVPAGFANGFLSLEDDTTLLYLQSNIYSPEHDTGIHWRSAGIQWPCENPLVSERDDGFVDLKDYKTPFCY